MTKKIFGGINLTWPKVIAMGIIMGVYTAIMAMVPILKDTSFHDIAVTLEVWIFFGIFIIMNSKSASDSALKCFVFFLISQPLVYLVQDIINSSTLFQQFYGYWFKWTIACLPMGFIGYYIKKDKWWSLLILLPLLLLLGEALNRYLSMAIFSFPRHLLTAVFCAVTLIIYPLALFNNKKVKIVGVTISSLIIIAMTALCIIKPAVYSTDILLSGNKYHFNDKYKVYLKDKKYGKLSIEYEEAIEEWLVHAEFKKGGKTKFILESPEGEKKTFDITIKRDTFSVKEIKKSTK